MTEKDWPALKGWSGTAARRATQSFALKAPGDGTAKAFVVWLQAIGETGEFYQEDLFEQYTTMCALAGHDVGSKWKHFKRDLQTAGCGARQADERVRGSGPRRWKVSVPSMADQKLPAKLVPIDAKSVPTRANAHSKPISKHLAYLAKAA
jgi:hypothetical protein